MAPSSSNGARPIQWVDSQDANSPSDYAWAGPDPFTPAPEPDPVVMPASHSLSAAFTQNAGESPWGAPAADSPFADAPPPVDSPEPSAEMPGQPFPGDDDSFAAPQADPEAAFADATSLDNPWQEEPPLAAAEAAPEVDPWAPVPSDDSLPEILRDPSIPAVDDADPANIRSQFTAEDASQPFTVATDVDEVVAAEPASEAPIEPQPAEPSAGSADDGAWGDIPAYVSPGLEGGGSDPVPPEEPEVDELTIGRSRLNSIVLDDMLVSRRHVSISADEQGLLLRDLGSRNGTYVNGNRVETTHLHEGDHIGIGTSTFEVRDGWLVSV